MAIDKTTKENLLAKLSEMNIFDLERLRTCFEYELKVKPKNKDDLEDIIEHIIMTK